MAMASLQLTKRFMDTYMWYLESVQYHAYLLVFVFIVVNIFLKMLHY